jgi:hypothetical protein
MTKLAVALKVGRWKLPKTIHMTVEQWAKIQQCPRQRHTESHAKKAIKHLQNVSPAQARVSMAVLPSGETYKLDGHTRSLLWMRNEIARPPELIVDVYEVSSIEDVKELYDHFDNKNAAEDTADRLSGALNEHDINLKSTLMQRLRFSTGLRYAHSVWHDIHWEKQPELINTIVGEWREPLMIADRFDLKTGKRFPSGLWTAIFLTARRDGEVAGKFWISYDQGRGERYHGVTDSIQALEECVLRLKSSRGKETSIMMAQYALSAYDGWFQNRTYQGPLRPLHRDTLTAWRKKRLKNHLNALNNQIVDEQWALR